MNKLKIFIGAVILLGIIGLLFGLKSCNNSKIQKDNNIVQQNDGEVLILKKQRTADSLHLIKDSMVHIADTRRNDSLGALSAKIDLRYVYIYQSLDTLSPKAKLELAKKWLHGNIDSTGKLNNQGVWDVDSIVIANQKLNEQIANAKQVIASQKETIAHDSTTITDCKDENNINSEIVSDYTVTEKALKDEIVKLNHNSFISKIFSWSKNAIIIVAVGIIVVSNHLIR